MKQRIHSLLKEHLGIVIKRAPKDGKGFWPAPELPNELIRNCKLVENRKQLIRSLEFEKDELVVTEVGVAFGDFSEFLLEALPISEFYAIDLFELHKVDTVWGVSTKEKFQGGTHLDYYQNRFTQDQRVTICRRHSHQQLNEFEDGTFDLIYIDAGHDYQSVKNDLTLAARKIRTDGVIVMNDYAHMDPSGPTPYGIPRATHEFMLEHQWEMTHLALHPWGLYDVALKKAGRSPC